MCPSMEQHQKELQLLPPPQTQPSSSHASSWPSDSSIKFRSIDPLEGPSVDLQLSMSLRPMKPPSDCVEALKWQAAEQIRLAAVEKSYAERVRELTRREMEMAQSEFARARYVWERAREDFEKAEKMKERASRRIDSTCIEISCQSCRQKFRP
ncbi:unnamed protein product [Ilex paraguariensis]|uniref:Uncharacterized protein n=1 Tax=Ilex paraguariensis TaxID=185542 RepID=A0ABC8TR32_9AQUA